MDAYQAVIRKRDRRDFDSRPLEPEVLHRILQAGRMAGSGSNRQPWRFIVVTDEAAKEKLSTTGRGGGTIKAAPLGIVILLEKGERDDAGRVRDGFDAGRAGQNMMLAAWNEGILNCPVGLSDHEICQEVLGYPDEYDVCLGIAFGYPAPSEPSAEPRQSRPRTPLEEITHYERWGNQV
jgi:nitroreductase